MSPRIWSDEDRLFIPRMGGWSVNFKFIAKKLGWIRQSPTPDGPVQREALDSPTNESSREERLRSAIERSRAEDSKTTEH